MTEFFQWIGDAFIASWGDFDIEILRKELVKNKIITPYDDSLKCINIKKVYTAVKHIDYKKSLFDSLNLEQINFEGTAHRAYDDAYNTYRLYIKNQNKMEWMIGQLYSTKLAA